MKKILKTLKVESPLQRLKQSIRFPRNHERGRVIDVLCLAVYAEVYRKLAIRYRSELINKSPNLRAKNFKRDSEEVIDQIAIVEMWPERSKVIAKYERAVGSKKFIFIDANGNALDAENLKKD